MKTTFKSEQQIEIVEDQNQGQMVGPSDAEAAVVEATGQRKQTGLKRVKTRAEKDKHNAACRESRKKIKLRHEYLEKLDKEVPELRAEIQVLKSELGKPSSKTPLLEGENKELKADKEQAASQENMVRKIFTMIQTLGGQMFSSIKECEAWLLSQDYGQQVCQGSAFTKITASDAGPSFPANPDFTTLLGVLNINLFSPDLAAATLSNPGPGSSSGADRGMPVLDEKDVDQCISEMLEDPDSEKTNFAWQF